MDQKRILVVDDDDLVRNVLIEAIESLGYGTAAAGTASEARAFLQAQSFDLVILDAKLPDGNGIALADEAKARNMKAVVLTGYMPEARREGQQHDYLFKPIRRDEIARAVERYIGPPKRK